MKDFLLASNLLSNKAGFNFCIDSVYNAIEDLNGDYPSFCDWYYDKVLPEIITGKRDIIVVSYNNLIAGISIVKNSENEKKICTLRVLPQFKNSGIGKMLFEKSFESLNIDKPIITVSETRINEFSRLLSYYNFKLEQVSKDIYSYGKSEYVFNGNLAVNQNNLKGNLITLIPKSTNYKSKKEQLLIAY